MVDGLPPSFIGMIRIHFINVGFGDCILIQSPDKSENILVDYRNDMLQNQNGIIKYLQNAGVTRNKLKAVIISHYHQDHFKGILTCIVKFNVPHDKVFVSPYQYPSTLEASRTYDAFIRGSALFTKITAPNSQSIGTTFNIDFFSPRRELVTWYSTHTNRNPNNSSLGFILSCKWNDVIHTKILFPGDMQGKAWRNAIFRNTFDISCDIFKIAHHGSHNGTPDYLINKMLITKPSYCVVMDHEKGSKKGIKLKEVTIKRLKRIIESGVIVPNEVGKILNLRDNTVTISSEIFPRGAIILDIIPPNGANLRKINSWYIFTDEYGGILGYTSEKALAIYKQGRTVPDPWTLDNSDNIAYPDANIVDITRGKMLEIYTSCGKPFDI